MMPALVSRNFDAAAAQQNDVIRVAKPQSFGAPSDFDPVAGSTSSDLSDDKIDITLEHWRYVQFQVDDRELRETTMSAVLPSAFSAALKSLANQVDRDLLALLKDVPNFAGTFAVDVSSTNGEDVIVDARESLQTTLAPMNDRHVLLNVNTESALLKSVAKFMETGNVSTEALREAALGRLFGMNVFSDQLMPRHVSGTATGATLTLSAAVSAGASTIPVGGASGTLTLAHGDIFSIEGMNDESGDPVLFVVSADTAAVSGAFASLPISPPLPVGATSGTGLTVYTHSSAATSSRQSIAFQRDFAMLAMRPLAATESESSTISTAIDSVSGLPLRLESWRSPKHATRFFRFDLLYGCAVIDPALACRIFG